MLCVFSYVAAGSEQQKKGPPVSPNMQAKQLHPGSKPNLTHPQPTTQQQPSHKVQHTHLPQQKSPQLQSTIHKTQPQNNKPIPTTTALPMQTQIEQVQPAQKLPSIPARPAQPSTSGSSPPSSEPPKIEAPTLPPQQQKPETPKLVAQGSQGSIRGPPPAIPPRQNPVRSGSVQSPPVSVPAIRPVKRQTSISQMPQCTPMAPPPFVIPQRRGSITRQTSVSSNSNGGTPKKS